MIIYITGTTGFLGKVIAAQLIKLGHLVSYPTRQDLLCLSSLAGYDVVIHAAAEIYDESVMFKSNIELTYNLLTLAEHANVKKFIYLGSSSEYGRWGIPLHEGLHPQPTNMYEATKYCGTVLCQVSRIPTLVIRPFSVYGPGEPSKRFIPKIYTAAINNMPLTVGPGVHDFIYIDDFVDGLIKALELDICGILNLGSGKQYSNIEVMQVFENVMNKSINWSFDSSLHRSFDTDCWVCDTNYIHQVLNWLPPTTLSEGISRYVQYQLTRSTV